MKSHKHYPIIPMSRLWEKEKIWENTTMYYCKSCGKQLSLCNPGRVKVVERRLKWFSILWLLFSLIIPYLCNADWSLFVIFVFWLSPPLVASILAIYVFPRYFYEWKDCSNSDDTIGICGFDKRSNEKKMNEN